MADTLDRLRAALVGRYRLERELGAGGMATVYLAEDLKHQRKVAVKVLHPDLAHSVGAERFVREIATTAQLSHPHILPLLDSGEADGLLFYVMPYVDGETLRERIRRESQLPLDDALRITCEVADALGYAHRHAVVHRDIKPENILLQAGHAVVADFGIARAVTAAAGDRLTGTGLAVGTPAYMSPEQAGGGSKVDGRSDLYALGCVLYEMLAGEPPYTGPTPQSILAKKLTEPLPRVAVVRDTVPAAVESALARVLARMPADRFSTAEQFAEALRTPIAESGTLAGRSRRRALPLILAAAGLALTAGVIGLTVFSRSADARIASLAVLPPQDLTGDSARAYFVLGVHDGLIAEMNQIATLRVISRTSTMAYAGTGKPVPQIARELDVDAVVECSVRQEGDSIHVRVQLIRARPSEKNIWGRRYDRHSRDVLKLYGEVAQDVARETSAKLTAEQSTRIAAIRQVNPATYESYVRGMYFLHLGTQKDAERGLAVLHEAIKQDPGDPLAWAGLATGYITAAHGPAPPVDALPLARAAAERALRLDPSLTETMASLAFLRGYYDWEWAEAEQLFKRALAANPSSADAHYWYAWQLALFDRMDEAIEHHISAKKVDPLNPNNTADLGWLYCWQGRYDEALEEARRAIALAPGFPGSYVVISEVRSMQGRHDEAVAAARQAVEADASWKWVLGYALARAGREAEARKVLAELRASPVSPWNAISLAIVHASVGDNDEAFRWLNYEHPHAWVPWVRVIPWFSGLWDDPRLPALLEKMNLPPRKTS